MKSKFTSWLSAVGFIIIFTFSVFAQTPTPPDEPIKVLTEEVHLNVTAQTDYGRIVPNLKIDDLLIVEEGTPQTITSIKQIPANVLLMLDTGGNLTFAKNKAMTGITTKVIAKYLSPNATWYLQQSTAGFSAVQFGLGTDIPAPADYDGDGKADISVFRPSNGAWYRINSSNNAFVAISFGLNGDVPIPAFNVVQ